MAKALVETSNGHVVTADASVIAQGVRSGGLPGLDGPPPFLEVPLHVEAKRTCRSNFTLLPINLTNRYFKFILII